MGYTLTLQRNSDNHAFRHPAGANNIANLVLAGRVNIEDTSLYVPHYSLNISNQKLMLGHIVSEAETELSYNKRSSYMKDVTTENSWILELRVGDGFDILFYVIVGFMQRDQFNRQNLKIDTSCRPSVVNAQSIIGSEKLPDAGLNCI